MLVPDRAGPVMKTGAGTAVAAREGSRAVGVEHRQPGAQVAQGVVAAQEPAHDVQLRLGVERRDQAAVGLLPVGLAEVVEPGGGDGQIDQLVGVERDDRSRPSHPCGHGIEAPDDVRARWFEVPHGRGS